MKQWEKRKEGCVNINRGCEEEGLELERNMEKKEV